MGSAPSPLSIVRVTSARPSGARPDVPAKITSSIFPPRRALAPCSPSTHAMASTTFDLPEPFGPTTQVMPGSSFSVVAAAKDLKPLTVRLLRCTRLRSSTSGAVRGLPRAGYRSVVTQPGNRAHGRAVLARHPHDMRTHAGAPVARGRRRARRSCFVNAEIRPVPVPAGGAAPPRPLLRADRSLPGAGPPRSRALVPWYAEA